MPRNQATDKKRLKTALIALVPVLAALVVWLSPLAFVPVPWPDDSAFYFVADQLFSWPPRWVMLPQAPFEPSYTQWNFNTMPLFPVLIGIGKFFGINGSFSLKIWPLAAWAAGGALLIVTLARSGLRARWLWLLALAWALDPALRWSSVLVRPESLIALFGVTLVAGLTLGFPRKWEPRRLWDPIAALLALGAYTHFNAIHLVFPVILAFALKPGRLLKIGALTTLYVSPWIVTVLWHWDLFERQMQMQWRRLAVPNSWLESPKNALTALFENMGSPYPWDDAIRWSAAALWIFIAASLVTLLWDLGSQILLRLRPSQHSTRLLEKQISLIPASGWILGSVWLFDSKPEVWFTHYIHAALWTWAGFFILGTRLRWARPAIAAVFMVILAGFVKTNAVQWSQLWNDTTWRWSTYEAFVDCVDGQLSDLDRRLGHSKPLRVWCPTAPDITIELSRRHPEWEFTRTCDFSDRWGLAIRHGKEVEAVVVTESYSKIARDIEGPAANYPEVQSLWLNWKDYFLNKLYVDLKWKPRRSLCQRGKWQAFIFTNEI